MIRRNRFFFLCCQCLLHFHGIISIEVLRVLIDTYWSEVEIQKIILQHELTFCTFQRYVCVCCCGVASNYIYKYNLQYYMCYYMFLILTSFHLINMVKLSYIASWKTVTVPLRWWVRSFLFLHLGDDCHRCRFSRPWHQRHNLDLTILLAVENTSFHKMDWMLYPTSNYITTLKMDGWNTTD